MSVKAVFDIRVPPRYAQREAPSESVTALYHEDLICSANGGRAWPCEPDEATIKRAVLEETGLVVTSARFVFSFDEPIAHTSVFEVEATGT